MVTQVSEVTGKTFNATLIPEFRNPSLCIRDDNLSEQIDLM